MEEDPFALVRRRKDQINSIEYREATGYSLFQWTITRRVKVSQRSGDDDAWEGVTHVPVTVLIMTKISISEIHHSS